MPAIQKGTIRKEKTGDINENDLMRRYVYLALLLIQTLCLYSQGVNRPLIEGKVSYITLQNIYAKFEMSGLVKAGDTVFIRKNEVLVPLFVAESISSQSCVGKPMFSSGLKVSDVVFIKRRTIDKATSNQPDSVVVASSKSQQPAGPVNASVAVSKPEQNKREQKIRGRLSVSSYSGFSNSSDFSQRLRYTFSMTADHISNSRFSFDNYILFTHKTNQWAEVQDNLFNALKIYSLAASYDVSTTTRFTLGRKINPRLASVGAIDGFQVETTIRNFSFGAVVGANPDYTDYSFNPKLFEYGGYLSHDISGKNGQLVNSFAFLQQTNSGKTDRRFAYFQHDNSLIKNLNLFVSCEVDLYALRNGVPTNVLSLTSLYLSLRYRFSKQLSVFASYDARKNVIYYETFKNYLDQMLEDATRQGYQFRVNYNPGKLVSTGLSGGYRFRSGDLNPTMNANGFLTFNRLPWGSGSVSFSSNYLKNSYINGMIYGVRIYQDLIPSKLSSGVFYRYVDYKYPQSNTTSLQHMVEFELSWQISRKISFSANYDGTIEKSNLYNNVYLSLIKRF